MTSSNRAIWAPFCSGPRSTKQSRRAQYSCSVPLARMRMTFSTFVTPTRDSAIGRVGTSDWTSRTWWMGVGSIDSPAYRAASKAPDAQPVWDTRGEGRERSTMAGTSGINRAQVREAVERAGDEHWQALIRHHEDAYPASRPTPGDVCRAEAERLNQLGLGDAEQFALVETRVERTDSTVRLVHVFECGPRKARLLTEPFEGYGGEEGAGA